MCIFDFQKFPFLKQSYMIYQVFSNSKTLIEIARKAFLYQINCASLALLNNLRYLGCYTETIHYHVH